jgi:hypothetical protein
MLARSAILTLKITFKPHNFRFSNEVTLTSAFDTKGTPGLELPYLHSTGYEPKASDARRFDTWFVLPSSKLSAARTR